MYELLKTISATNNWNFTYARRDFANLYDGEQQVGDSTPLVFLDPVQITEAYDEFNNVIETNYAGSFMVLVSSDIDEEDYDYRYQTYIKPIINSTLLNIKSSIQCDGNYGIELWRSVEIINAFDFNADGVVITFSINE
ncbi:hypothetical protein [Bizionia psychrotolerans]|uniref:hypothetical protein n=1 Tax=Bizionia psychrotolerans TaxID=1492901 RepID=UPI0006512D8A|nr:hypothetical protein [Bizionia psychrotolerans]